MANSWSDPDHSHRYLARAADLPHREEGEFVLLDDLRDVLPGRVLDLGCGDGRLAALVLDAYPGSTAVCVDFSDTMLVAAAARFGDSVGVEIVRHDLSEPLPSTGPFDRPFDAVVSSLAIHHMTDDRKPELDREVADLLRDGGVFANLDVVASPTPKLHARWRDDMGVSDDRSDVLRDVASQLQWLSDAGFEDVDCIWKWRSVALMRGQRRG